MKDVSTILEGKITLDDSALPLHLFHVGSDFRVVQLVDDIGDGAAVIAVAHREQLRQCRREVPDAQLIVEEDGRDLRAVQQVLQVSVGARQ